MAQWELGLCDELGEGSVLWKMNQDLSLGIQNSRTLSKGLF